MADYDINELVSEINEQIATRPITKPKAGQRVDHCHYSRTGWAVHESDGACTCMPAEPPRGA